jgi:hypothetical protein
MTNEILTRRDDLYRRMIEFVKFVRGGDIHGYCQETLMNNQAAAILQENAEIEILMKNGQDIIEDGFGSSWSAYCAMCGKKSMHIVRPGKVQCGFCG